MMAKKKIILWQTAVTLTLYRYCILLLYTRVRAWSNPSRQEFCGYLYRYYYNSSAVITAFTRKPHTAVAVVLARVIRVLHRIVEGKALVGATHRPTLHTIMSCYVPMLLLLLISRRPLHRPAPVGPAQVPIYLSVFKYSRFY